MTSRLLHLKAQVEDQQQYIVLNWDIYSDCSAPLTESDFTIMLELRGCDSSSDRLGLDLVVVLDVSKSMDGEKISKMRSSMLFMIIKLTPIDRLSIVTFSTQAKRLCPLRQVSKNFQIEFENMIKSLKADGETNITAGLETGIKVFDRSLSRGRVAAMILMSDGGQDCGGDAAEVFIGNVLVHTFGFGINHDTTVLKAIADNSEGGTFSDVRNTDNLNLALFQCLAGLLTVDVQDFKLVVMPKKNESKITEVVAGNYSQCTNLLDGSVITYLGDLHRDEVRKILINLHLPNVKDEYDSDVLTVAYFYRTPGGRFESSPKVLIAHRTGAVNHQKLRTKVVTEMTRIQIADMIKESRCIADDKDLVGARNKLVEALNSLEDRSNPLSESEMLKNELQQLLKLMISQDIYGKRGRFFALSSESSHACQRYAARGDMESLRLFATESMNQYLEQAKEEIATNFLDSSDQSLRYCIHAVIQSLLNCLIP